MGWISNNLEIDSKDWVKNDKNNNMLGVSGIDFIIKKCKKFSLIFLKSILTVYILEIKTHYFIAKYINKIMIFYEIYIKCSNTV